MDKIKPIALLFVFFGALFYFYEFFLRIAPSVMQPELMRDLHVGVAGFGIISAFYLYAYTPMQLVVGILIDKFLIKWVLVFAILICAIGSLIFAITDNLLFICLGRFLQGFGSAFAFVSALKLASIWLPSSRFAFFSCLCAALGYFGAGIGEIVFSYLVSELGWRHSILTFAWIGFLLAIIFAIFLKNPPGNKSTRSSEKIVVLSWKEAFKQLLDIIGKDYIWYASLISFFMYLPTVVFAGLWGVTYIEKLHHYSPEKAALASGLIYIGWAVGLPIQGFISDLICRRLRIIWINACCSCVLSVCVLYIYNLPQLLVYILFFLIGVFSCPQMLTYSMANDVCNKKGIGMAIGFISAFSMLGGLIFQSTFGLLLNYFWSGEYNSYGEKIYSLLAYEKAVFIVPASFLITMIIALCVKDRCAK